MDSFNLVFFPRSSEWRRGIVADIEVNMRKTGIVILVHGSRGERAMAELPGSLQRISEGLRKYLNPGVEIAGAALQFNKPGLEEAVASLAGRGVRQVVIMPYFLFAGRHITEDIPEIIDALQKRYTQLQFTVTRPLGASEAFVNLVARRIEEAAPELFARPIVAAHPGGPSATSDIERRSMEIVDRLVPGLAELPAAEQAVVKRVVHASGDPGIAPLVRFGNGAAAAGIMAVASGCAIFTDVRMVSVGINRRNAGVFGCNVICTIEAAGEPAAQGGDTRAAAAMRRQGRNLDGAVIAIGNAPTALLALLEMIKKDGVKPALVVGMPVGFVQAEESKEALAGSAIPYITITGTRGGSSMAAAAVNALLKTAVENRA